MDHTFWVAKFVREANGDQFYYAMLTVMNEYAEVMGFYFCSSKSLYELKEEMSLMNSRYAEGQNIKVVYTDNARADEMFLRSVFGDSIQVKRDIFHVLNDYFKSCYKHPLRSWFMGEIRECFFTDDLDDKEAIVRMLIQQHPEEFPLDVLATKDDTWFRSRIRKYIVNAATIKKDLRRVYGRYKDFNRLFKVHMEFTHQSVLEQLDAGYLTDPVDENVYFNISEDLENPKYITIRGTSQLESLHYHIQKILSGPNCREETIHLALTDRLYRWNIAKGALNRQEKNDMVYDPKLKSEIDFLRSKLLMKKKYFIPTVTTIEGFGILRRRFASESYIASQTIIPQRETFTSIGSSIGTSLLCYRKGILKEATPIITKAEKTMYKILVEEDDSLKQMALNWNHLILNALTQRKQSISLFSKRHECEVHLPVTDLFLKDSRHFVLFEASIKKAQEVFSLFWNEDHFKAFRLTRKNGKSISGGSRPRAPERLPFLATDEESITQNEEVVMSSVEQVEEEHKRVARQCPLCKGAFIRHGSKNQKQCELYQFYINRKSAHESREILIKRKGKETMFDAVVREYKSLFPNQIQ
jgi:hypothetical protein